MFSVRGGPYYTALTEQDDSSSPGTKGGLHAPPAALTSHPGKGALFPCDQALDTHRKASLITPTTTSTTNTTTTTLTHITTTTSTNTINNNNLLHHQQHHNTSINNNAGGGGGGGSSSSNNSTSGGGSTPGLRYHSSSLDNSLLSSSHQVRGTIAGGGGGSSAAKGGGSSSPLSLTSLKAAWKSLTSITSSSSSSKLPHLERQADTLAILSSSSSSSSSSGHHHHQGSSSSSSHHHHHHHLQQGQDYRYTQVPSAGTSALQILSGGGGSGGGKRHKDGVSGGGSGVGSGLHHQTLHNTHIYLTPATRSYTHPHRSPLQPPPASCTGHHHHHGGGGGARGSNNSSSFRTNASSHSSRSGGNFSSSSSSVSRATGEALTLAKCLRKHKEKQQKIHEQALTRKSKSDNALQKIGVNLKSQSDQNLHKVWLVGAGGSQASSCCTTNNTIFSTVQLSGGSGDSTASVASNNSSSSYKKRRRRLLAGIGLEEEIRRKQQQEEREERSRSLERNHGNRIHSSSNTRRHTRSLERNHKFRVDLRNLIPSPPLCPHIDPTPPDHPAPSPPTHAIPFLPNSISSSTHHSFHSSSNSPSLPSYSSSSHSSSNTYSPTPHDTFSSTAHPRLGTIAASAHSPFQSSHASAHSSIHSSLASAHSSHSSGSSGSGGFLPSSSSLEGRLCCTATMDAAATTNGTTSGPTAPGGSSFINKPARGWLHSDTQLAETGVTYGVRYIGCLEVKTSMKSLNFDTRSLIAKECISRVCEAAGLKTVDRRRKVVKAIGRILGESPVMQHAGSNVTLTITSTALSLSLLDNGQLIAHHDMPNISFASGGDPDTLDFIAYVAKDCLYGRACFVLECGGGQAQNVITSIGQAFEMRFKEYLKKTPQPSSLSPAGVAAVGAVTGGGASLINNVNAPLSTLTAGQPGATTNQTHNNNMTAPSAGAAQPSVNYTTVNNPDRLGCPGPRNDDPEYYNDLPGKVPPDLIPPVSQPPPVPPLPNYNCSAVQQQQQQQHSNISNVPSVLSNPTNNGSSNNLMAAVAEVTTDSLDDQTASLNKACYVTCSPPLGDAPRPPSASAGTNLIDLCGDAVSPAPSSTAGPAVAPLRCEPEYANVPLSKQGLAQAGNGEGGAAALKDPFDMQPFTAPLSQAESSSTGPKCLSAQQRRELQQESWYHGPITRVQAENLLKQDGDFLVRESLNTSGQYVLTGVQNNTSKHLLLIDPNGVIRTKCQTFSSVSHLINYHRDNELPIVSNESALVLRNAVVRLNTPPQPR